MTDKHLRTWFVVFVIAVFVAGLGGGVILDRYVGRPLRIDALWGRRGAGFPGPGRGRGPATFARSLATDLNLTPEQKTKLDAILTDRRKRMEQINGELRERFEAEQRDMRAEIEKILTPDQRRRFDEWLPAEGTPGLIWRGLGPGRGPGRGMGPGPGRGRGPGF